MTNHGEFLIEFLEPFFLHLSVTTFYWLVTKVKAVHRGIILKLKCNKSISCYQK